MLIIIKTISKKIARNNNSGLYSNGYFIVSGQGIGKEKILDNRFGGMRTLKYAMSVTWINKYIYG